MSIASCNKMGAKILKSLGLEGKGVFAFAIVFKANDVAKLLIQMHPGNDAIERAASEWEGFEFHTVTVPDIGKALADEMGK